MILPGVHDNRDLTLPPVYPILDITTLSRRDISPILFAEGILEAGAAILQLRHKDLWTRDTLTLATQLAQLCQQANATFILNDRADYAAILGVGLHVGQDDLTPTDARRVIGADAILGYSTHNPDQMTAAQAEPADYVAFGPVFPTASKERPDPTTGLDGLRAVRALTQRPVVAIGGITRDNARTCWNAGADS
ncbi:MAG TPA: thiamine phosphate synthase, partial [Bryobacteraceae bacterium]|nr:thiamine phosphate synthase [Bryobacteraceae bacterium]